MGKTKTTSHALLSPSGASRWMACPASARLEEQFPDVEGDAAKEGTLAHRLAELTILNNLKRINKVDYTREMKIVKNSQFFNADMVSYVLDYVQFVLDRLAEVGGLTDASIFTEQRIDLTEFVPEGYGTGDIQIISANVLDFIDYKHGKGVLVDVNENKQCMLYALGALKKARLMFDIELVRITIYQPRLDNIASYEIGADELLQWGETVVKPAAKLAFEGKGGYKAGGHCRFCRAKTSCRALADHNMDLAKYAFEDPNKLDDEDLVTIFEKIPDLINWADAIKEHMTEAARSGKTYKGLKLVTGRSNRVYSDKTAIIKALAKAKIDKGLYLSEPELVSLTALEANISKPKVIELIGGFIIKPQGKPALVPEWDRRDGINSPEAAKKAFEGIDLED